MISRHILAIVWLCMGSTLLYGRNCELGKMFIGDQGKVNNWIGSYEKALNQPEIWKHAERLQISRSFRPKMEQGSLFAVGLLTADEAYSQGLNVVMGRVQIRLNGKVLKPETGMFYSLALKKGKNLIELKITHPGSVAKSAKKKKKPKFELFLTLVDLEYIFTQPSQKLEYAERAIRFLGKKYAAYDAAGYLKQLNRLAVGNASDKAVEDFRYDALVRNNPELNFSKVLFRQSGSHKLPANWKGDSTYLRQAGKERRPNFGDSFRILDLKTRKMETIYEPKNQKEGLLNICLDWDAAKFLYTGVETKTNTLQLYEMNLDGSGKNQKTPYLPQIDNYNGIYLPNGKILFCSTASLNSVPCVGGKDYVGTLFEIGMDGKGMRQVCFDQENDWYPWVKDNGRVMYHRWEYTDNSHYFTRILMEMNPDGTNNRSIYGSNSFWPNTLFYAKQIPGKDSMFSAIVSGHHGGAREGELWIFDSAKGDFEGEGIVRKIPGYGRTYKPRHLDKYAQGKLPLFVQPYPLSENFFLVSCKQKKRDKWNMYLVDTFDNMIKLSEDNRLHQFEPVPIMKRTCPPAMPERRDPNAKDATLYIQDIYVGRGLDQVPRGEIKALRIFTYGYAYRNTGSHDALAIEGGWDTKRVLGTVPVEKDGSVMAKIPHSLPLSLQPIDKDGKALQVMRSWLAAQPGEVVSCVGCHEPSRTAPLPRATIATRKTPQKMTPWSKVGRPYGYGFRREIQPILDKYCIGCHDGGKKELPNFNDITEVEMGKKESPIHFSKSYMALHPYVRRPGPESDLHILTAMDYHASTSELIQMLEKGHHGVKIDDDSMRELITWIDLNVPYHATWKEFKNDKMTCELAAKTVEYKRRFSNIDDDIEWMPPLPKRAAFVKPKPEKRPAALTLKGWPLSRTAHKQLASRTIKYGEHKLKMVHVPAGKFVMGSVTGEPDEYPQSVVEIEHPFWMSTTEITNAQFRGFDSKHDSRFIDQQWKDHVYPGYPADQPEMPVVRVTWDDAVAFTQWLSKEIGEKVCLPTEAQWEWAARSGSNQPYFFGNSGYEAYANLADKNIAFLAVSGVDPRPVAAHARSPLNDFVPRDDSFDDGRMLPDGTAQYKPNRWGLYDMHGNVAEWTRSSYLPYPYTARDGRNDPTNRERKVVRGGSWRDRPKRATASYRLPYAPFQKVYNVGFRVIIEE